jgi:antitoxin (DNA-binding transcriptional repressor) of toxin-antitoxin stability system
MKVKVGQLKTHLSAYLRELQRTGEPLEVCVRESVVAYLSPSGATGTDATRLVDTQIIEQRLKDAGLSLRRPALPSEGPFIPTPTLAGDGKRDISTLPIMRAERDW